MSATSRSLTIKFLLTFGVATLTLSGFDTNPLPLVFLYSLIAVAVNYLVGDSFVLPSMGNLTASVGDGIMAALVAYLYSEMVVNFRTSILSLIALGVMIAIVEFLFHGFILKSHRVEP